MKRCLFCNKEMIVNQWQHQKKYCDKVCLGKHRWVLKKEHLTQNKKKWLGTPKGHYSLARYTVKKNYKIEKEDFDNCVKNGCQECGFKEDWLLDFHHIDGNHSNNERSNLIYLCPNCHNRKERRKIE